MGHLALEQFYAQVHHHHVLIRSDNMAVEAPLLRHATTLLLWADQHLLSIRAVHVPGHLNRGADMLSREGLLQGEWRLHPQTVSMIWIVFRQE